MISSENIKVLLNSILRTFQIVWQQLVHEILEFVGFAAFQSDWWLKEMDWPLTHVMLI